MDKTKKSTPLPKLEYKVTDTHIHTSSYIIKMKKDWGEYKKGTEISCVDWRAQDLVDRGYGEFVSQEIISLEDLDK